MLVMPKMARICKVHMHCTWKDHKLSVEAYLLYCMSRGMMFQYKGDCHHVDHCQFGVNEVKLFRKLIFPNQTCNLR